MIQRVDNKIVPLINAPLTLTGAWQDLGTLVPFGPQINVMDCQSISVWLNVDINDSLNVRLRVVALPSDGSADEYNLPILSVNAAVVRAEAEFVELNVDADQKIVLSFPTVDQVPIIKVQVMAGTVGATAGQLLSAGISFKSNLGVGG